MANGGMAKTLNERMSAVADAPTEDFGELLKLAGLDPARNLRFQEWSGSNFAESKLSGCDFTGARLLGCDFTGAVITGARFDQAILHQVDCRGTEASYFLDDDGSYLLDDDGSRLLTSGSSPTWTTDSTLITADSTSVTANPSSAPRTNLRAAADWDAFVAGWRRRERLARDRHLGMGAVFQDAPFGPELVVVPPGRFMRGSPEDEPERSKNEGPRREVTIAQALAVGRYAVTFAEWDFAQADKEWQTVTGHAPHEPDDAGWGRGSHPVINVSWVDARAYARWLSAKTGQAYRLLSEAEWEYCCRAGTTTPFWWGSVIARSRANYGAKDAYDGDGEFLGQTEPVDAFAPNAWDLHQMHGNVWEWVEDTWHYSYAGAPADGSAWTAGDSGHHVLRGGSLLNDPQDLRSAARYGVARGDRTDFLGFRLSRTLNP